MLFILIETRWGSIKLRLEHMNVGKEIHYECKYYHTIDSDLLSCVVRT